MTDVIRGRLFASLTLALLAGATAWADPPAAVVEGSLVRPSGRSVLLDARKSKSDRPLQWKLISPTGVPHLTFDTAPRKSTYFFIPDPDDGVYHVALTAVGKVGDELEADTAVVQVVVGGPLPVPPAPTPPGPTPPGPTPPPGPSPPDTEFGLAALVRTQAAAIPLAERQRGAGLLAAAYRETVRLARDGKFAGPQQVIDDARTRVGISRLPSWSGFTLGARLNELARAGKIATTTDVVRAFEEIAAALQEVVDGQ